MRHAKILTASAIALMAISGPAFAQTESEPAVPAANVDTNADGIADAWDTNADTKADAWDLNGDGAPDAYDADGDGLPDKAPEAAPTEPMEPEAAPQ